MRKIIALNILLLLVFNIFIFPASAASISSLNASINNITKLVTITGTISSGVGKEVTIRITDPIGNLEYINQKTSGEGGSFTFSYTMTSNVAGAYDVTVGGEGVSTLAKTTFIYTPAEAPAPPTVTSAVTNTAGTVITITFSKAMADLAGKHGQFSAIVGGLARTFSAVALDSDTTKINLTLSGTAIAHGATVTVSYTAGDVTAADGGVLASFSNRAVTNNVPAPPTPAPAPAPAPAPTPAPTPAPAPAVVIAEAAIARESTTMPDGRTMEKITLKAEAKEQITKAREEGKTAVEIKVEKVAAQVTTITVPKDVLQSAEGMSVVISTPKAALELPKELVKSLVAAGKDLSVQMEYVDSQVVSEQMVDVAGAEGAEVLGTPISINTDIKGTTSVTIPLTGIRFPAGAAEKQAFLDSLRVFAVHSDGEKKVIAGEIVFDAAGNPSGIKFTVDKFSTFAVIRVAVTPKVKPVEIKLTVGLLQASVNGKPYTLDAEPFVKPKVNRTLVPVRFLSEAMGASVTWVPDKRQVVIRDAGKEIVLTIGSDRVLVNGVEKTLDCPAEILPPGRTFVPLRFVTENLGARVHYDAKTREITITR
ncbi:MAG: stalk domain-containing protein [Bacillota bacterium]